MCIHRFQKNCFALSSSSAFASYPSSAKIAFVEFEEPVSSITFLLAKFGYTNTKNSENSINCVAI